MSFEVGAEVYGRFMGRYAEPLAPQLADHAKVAHGHHVLDVGCGPGALTGELVSRVGAAQVCAIDPSPPFVAATRERFPDADVREGVAEDLPWDDATFDAALAQLVVQFMDDPVRGLSEMARVTRPGGVVSACVWDHGGGRGPLSAFWTGARTVVEAVGEEHQAGTSDGELVALLKKAGLRRVRQSELAVSVTYGAFEEWWGPYTMGVGPAGDFVFGLSAEDRLAVHDACAAELGEGPFTIEAIAWAARGTTAA